MWNIFGGNKNKTEKRQYNLFEAIQKQDIQAVKELLNKGIDTNQKNASGNTALMVAVAYEYTKIISLLLSRGVDADVKNKYNKTALGIAIKNNFTSVIKIFKQYGYVLDKESSENLVGASKKIKEKNLIKNTNEKNISIEKIKQLTKLLKKIEITRGSYKNDRKTIYYEHYTFSYTIDTVDVYVSMDNNSDSKIYMSLRIGDENYNIYNLENEDISSFEENIRIIFIRMIDKTIELLQDKIKKIQDEKNAKDIQQKNLIDKLAQDIQNTSSSKKIEDSNLPKDTTDAQSQSIKNPNEYKFGATLLYRAIFNKNIGEIELLLKSGADINKENSDEIPYDDIKLNKFQDRYKTPIDASVKIADIEIVKLLVKYNADVNILLNKFIDAGHDLIVKYLIEESKDINKLGLKFTPLYKAVLSMNMEVIELILRKGANPNISNENDSKNVPLHLACKKQNLKVIKLLIEHRADANYKDYNGRTSLFNAIEATNANKEIIRFLIANGADIHKEDNSGISPLSFAESNKVSLVKVLTENKSPNSVDNDKNFVDKIVLQNKMINKLKDEIKTIKNSGTNNQAVENYKVQIGNLKETILSQSNEIKELQNKLIIKEQDTKELINNFMFTMNKLEEKIAKQKVVKTQIPLNIPTEKQSIKKDDGVIVKRDSFDDF